MGFIGRHPLVSMAWSLLLSFGARTAAAGLQIRAAFAAGGVAICNPSTHQARTSTSRLHSTSEPLKTLEGSDIYAAEEVIKKSRFIGLAAHCTNWDDAQSILESVRKDHPKSRHACFGFVSSAGAGGEGVGTERCSDDGEPTGTAGVPILGAIKGEGLSDTLCIVVRYSGGIKLGAGGLIRAYGVRQGLP